MGSRVHGAAAPLPRTTPHISSTQHRLMRQGHQTKEASLAADKLPAPTSASSALSNFRDASSSRSVTPHPFVSSSLKKSNNLPVASNNGVQSGPGETGAAREYRHGYHTLTSTSLASASLLMTGKHAPQPSVHPRSGLQGCPAKTGTHAKGTYQNGSEGRSGRGGGRGGGGRGGGRISGIPTFSSPGSNGSNPSAAVSFFARAAQKASASSKTKKQRTVSKAKTINAFPTNFSAVILRNPPPVPRNLLCPIRRTQNTLTGKVKVMLRVCPIEGTHSSFLTIDPHKNQVTAYDPSNYGHSVSSINRRHLPPKMFGFDAVFSPSDPLSEVCAMSLVDILQAVVGGADGCLFCYGHARIGKTYTMVGDESPLRLGIIPCAIAWLFRLINEQKEHTGARFSVRVSAVEVTGKQEVLKDLLADLASASEANAASPGMYLREDPVCGTQLENQSELRAPTAEQAAYFLDAAIAARTVPDADEDARNSHLLFTIHVYQYRVETSSEGQNGVAGGRSRLHLIDFGSCSRTREGSALSLSALGTVIMALLNGQRHVPYRESTLTQLTKDALGSLTCHACMIVHVSPAIQAYNESLQVMQLATRLQRMRTKRRSKFSSTSSEDSSCDENKRIRSRMRLGVRMGTLREGSVCSTDYTSSSEQSCDTVIFVGDNSCSYSDRDFSDCERTQMTAIPHLRFTPPSGLVKTSALSRVDEVIEARHGSGERLYSTPPYAPPSSSYGNLNLQSKSALYKSRLNKFGRNFAEQEMHDNEFSENREIRAGHSNGEQWIDGPGSIYKGPVSRDSEQWVDGPPEFLKDRCLERSAAIPSASKGGSSSVEAGNLPTGKLHATSSGISRLPHKAARTAKIAMLFRRESSPGESEDGNSQSKLVSKQAEQEENDLREQKNIQGKCGDVISGEQSCNPDGRIDHLSGDVPSSEKVEEVNEISILLPSNDATIKESELCDIEMKSFEKDCIQSSEIINGKGLTDMDLIETGISSVKPASKVLPGENVENCVTPIEINSRENLPFDPLGCEEKSQVIGIDEDNQKHLYKVVVNMEEKNPEINTQNEADCQDIQVKSRKSHVAELNIESLLLHNRESIYELQMDKELEHGSRESLQRLIYGSDDDSSAWLSEPHSVDMEESCEWLEEMSLDALSESVKQNGNQRNAKIKKESPTDCTTVASPCDSFNQTLTCSEGNSSALSFEATKAVVTDDCIAADASINFHGNKEKALPDSALNCSAENECSVREHLDSIVSPATSTAELISRPSSTPLKPSNIRLPNQSMFSKIPESLQKSDHCKKPPPTPRTSSLAKSNSCIASDQTINPVSVPETSRLQSGRMLSMPSLSKTLSPSHKKTEEKASSGIKKLTNFGFRSGQNSLSSPKSNCNSTTSKKTADCPSTSAKIPLLTSRSSSTLVRSQSQQSQQFPTAQKKSKHSSKKDTELICARVEVPPVTTSTSLETDSRLVSPYYLVTKPRISVHSSSCQGSDCSSVAENIILKTTGRTSEVEASSGYESMIRDSEFTGTSSSQDSNSEGASAAKVRGIKIFRKRAKGRSRSAPARWFSPEGTVRVSRRMFPLSRPAMGYYCAESVPEEPLEIKTFNSEDVERMSRWRKKEAELQSLQERRCRIQELLGIQATLKQNLARSKEILMVDRECWSYDLHIADNINRDDPSYLQALEKETTILEKRIQACKSRIMMVTCFDVTA